MIAFCLHCMQNACMTVQITIRNVPEDVRDELATRAALQRQSMQEYLLTELERLAARPTTADWLQAVRERKATYRTRVSTGKIVQARNADRR